jgi:hypothetical protein
LTANAVNVSPTQTAQPTVEASPVAPLLITLVVLSFAGSLLVFSKRH